MLYGAILRSTMPHARILRVDPAGALALAGVVAVVTGRDVPGEPGAPRQHGIQVRDTPVLATDRVRYVGEPIAAVAAADLDTAHEALRRILVELEPLPASFSVDQALATDGTPIHADGNLIRPQTLSVGDVEQALASADVVVSETFQIPAVQGVPLETHTVLAEWTQGGITVYSSTQTPFHVRRELAYLFDLPVERVRVVTRTLGGGFGAKAYARIEPLAVLLAAHAHRPVKFVLSRSEEFVTIQRQPAVITMTSGARRDGRLLALRAECTFLAGAYLDNTMRMLRHGLYNLVGPYRVETLNLLARGVYTNTPPCGPLRAPGTAQVTWAREAHLDAVADRLGMDPYEFRCRNLLGAGDRFVLGGPMGPVHLPQLLAAVRQEPPAQPDAGPNRRRGVGYAVTFKTTQTPSESQAVVAVDASGRVIVLMSTVEMGQGARTALGQIAADAMAVPLDRVDMSMPDTDRTPPDTGTVSSRSTFSMGSAIVRAATLLQSKLLDLAAVRLEISRDDLAIEEGRVRPVDGSSAGLEMGDLVQGSGHERLEVSASFTNEPMVDPVSGEKGVSTHHHQAAVSASVEVDLETGAIRVLEIRAATHAGVVINPTLAELQTEGSVAFGIGQALMEEILFEEGQVQNPSLADYLIPSALDMPVRLVVDLQEDHAREIHGVGETPLPAAVPALTNAVAQAIGARLHAIPITPERVLRARQEALVARRGQGGPAGSA